MSVSPRNDPVKIFQDLYQRPASALGVTLFILFLLLAVVGPWIVPYSENDQSVSSISQPPSRQHLFGTDNLGRDVFSRVILGARDIFLLAGVGTIVSVTIGTMLGLLSGYRGGWLDEGLMRFFDSLLAIPTLLLALVLVGTIGSSYGSVLIVIIVIYTPIVTRVVRSVVLNTRHQAYVEAAVLRGESEIQILGREVFPSILPTLSVEAALRFSYAIFLVASLGFLGLGVQPPSPDWGLMVKEARVNVALAPWSMFFPAMAISLIVIAVNLTADGLKRVLRAPD